MSWCNEQSCVLGKIVECVIGERYSDVVKMLRLRRRKNRLPQFTASLVELLK